jgi:hypothetical protein
MMPPAEGPLVFPARAEREEALTVGSGLPEQDQGPAADWGFREQDQGLAATSDFRVQHQETQARKLPEAEPALR